MREKNMLGTSDAWLMSPLPHRTSEPGYYIEDYRFSTDVSETSNWHYIKEPEM